MTQVLNLMWSSLPNNPNFVECSHNSFLPPALTVSRFRIFYLLSISRVDLQGCVWDVYFSTTGFHRIILWAPDTYLPPPIMSIWVSSGENPKIPRVPRCRYYLVQRLMERRSPSDVLHRPTVTSLQIRIRPPVNLSSLPSIQYRNKHGAELESVRRPARAREVSGYDVRCQARER